MDQILISLYEAATAAVCKNQCAMATQGCKLSGLQIECAWSHAQITFYKFLLTAMLAISLPSQATKN